jgi:endonuclease/exonuclease/phosphatase family metal-dependent hydrolase
LPIVRQNDLFFHKRGYFLSAALGHKKRNLVYLTLLVAVLMICIIWNGLERIPTGPAEGVRFAGAAPRPQADRTTIRVGTFNIHGGKGRDGRMDLSRTADCLKDLDLIALNEVHGSFLRQEDNQAALLGSWLNLAWLFAPTQRQWWPGEFGNGILTSLQVIHWQRIPLPGKTRGRHRNAVLAQLLHGDHNINILVTHIDRQFDQPAQLRTIFSLFLALAEPAILLGDLNATDEDPLVRKFLATPGVVDPVGGLLAEAQSNRIDWIFTRGLQAETAALCDNDASDHPCVRAELSISPATLHLPDN